MNTGDFLKEKNISLHCNQNIIVSEDNKTFNITSLLSEYANTVSKNYLCYSKIIEMIDESKDLKELEILVNRFFNDKR